MEFHGKKTFVVELGTKNVRLSYGRDVQAVYAA